MTAKGATELTGLRVTTIETRVAADGEVLVTGLRPRGLPAASHSAAELQKEPENGQTRKA